MPAPAVDEVVLGSVQPSREQLNDIHLGWSLLQHVVELDVGCSMAIREGDILAVEAVEGTAALIERAGALCRTKGWVLLKTGIPDRDPPVVDPETIRRLAAAGGRCLAIGADRVRLEDRDALIEAADRARLAIVAVKTAERDLCTQGPG